MLNISIFFDIYFFLLSLLLPYTDQQKKQFFVNKKIQVQQWIYQISLSINSVRLFKFSSIKARMERNKEKLCIHNSATFVGASSISHGVPIMMNYQSWRWCVNTSDDRPHSSCCKHSTPPFPTCVYRVFGINLYLPNRQKCICEFPKNYSSHGK